MKMTGRNGIGPMGPGAGKGRSIGAGYGQRWIHRDSPLAENSGGYCKCPDCGYIIPHSPAQPCNLKQCPKCGTAMAKC